MKAFVQKVIEDYPRYLQEEATFERHLETRENSDMRDALTMLKIRLGIVESWFALLDADERFAFRQTLQTDLNDTPARRAAAMMWDMAAHQGGRNAVGASGASHGKDRGIRLGAQGNDGGRVWR